MRVSRISTEPVEKEMAPEKVDLKLLDPIIEKYKGKKGSMIPLLQQTQTLFGYIPREAFIRLSDATGLNLSEMYGVATFYAQFRLNPVGKYIIKVCHGTACHVQNAKVITNSLKEYLKVEDGGTTPDGLFTLESVACLGCCSLAPVMMINNETYGKLSGASSVKVLKEYKKKESN